VHNKAHCVAQVIASAAFVYQGATIHEVQCQEQLKKEISSKGSGCSTVGIWHKKAQAGLDAEQALLRLQTSSQRVKLAHRLLLT